MSNTHEALPQLSGASLLDIKSFAPQAEPTQAQGVPADAPNAHEEQDLDAWECPDCGGAGRRAVYHSVTHQLGTDDLPFWEACETCDGIGYCGPDAEKLAALSKPSVHHTDSAPQAEPQPALSDDEIIQDGRVFADNCEYRSGRCVRLEFMPDQLVAFVRAALASPKAEPDICGTCDGRGCPVCHPVPEPQPEREGKQ